MWTYNYNYSNELCHYGVKGMKWGVRRNRKLNTLSKIKNKRSREDPSKYHDDYKKAHSKKNIKEMSDKELRDRLNRIQMEQQYTKLNPDKIDKGKIYAGKALKAIGTVATTTGTIITLYNNADKIKKIVNGGR